MLTLVATAALAAGMTPFCIRRNKRSTYDLSNAGQRAQEAGGICTEVLKPKHQEEEAGQGVKPKVFSFLLRFRPHPGNLVDVTLRLQSCSLAALTCALIYKLKQGSKLFVYLLHLPVSLEAECICS